MHRPATRSKPVFETLSGAADFQRVREFGKQLRAQGFDIYALKRDDAAPPRLGLAVSRRVGGAVVRNRWKRLLRTYVRLHALELGPVDVVIVPRRPPPPNLWALAEHFDKAWRRFSDS